jgi:hypothetical protein
MNQQVHTNFIGSMHKVLARINMLGVLAATNGTLRPMNTRFVLSKYWCKGVLWKTQFRQQPITSDTS